MSRIKNPSAKVSFIQDRLFVVYSANNSNVYHVRFDVRNGEKFWQCECIAAKKGLVCYHIVAGATANIYRQGLKKQTVLTANGFPKRRILESLSFPLIKKSGN